MKITVDRDQLLEDLNLVRPGLSNRDLLEQSSHFAFRTREVKGKNIGEVITFNDEIACRKRTKLMIGGAVPASTLLAILEKMPDKILEVQVTDDGELEFRGKGRKFSINRDAEVLLPIGKVLEEKPEDWKNLPSNFKDVINAVKTCVSDVEDNFALTCVHLTPNHVEACNGYQLMRWRCKTGVPKPFLVRGSALSQVAGLDVVKIAQTETWVHFRSSHGLIISCRRFVEEYPEKDIDEAIKIKGERVTLPKSLAQAADRAAVFADEVGKDEKTRVMVSLSRNKVSVKGTGLVGRFYEEKKAKYAGPDMTFALAPDVLRHIAEKYTDAYVTPTKFRASGGAEGKTPLWDYMTVLEIPKKKKD